jgi:hypothetical protein
MVARLVLAWTVTAARVDNSRQGTRPVKQRVKPRPRSPSRIIAVKGARATRAPSVTHALHHIVAAQQPRRLKVKWCWTR